MFTAAFRFKHQTNLAAMVKRFRQDAEATTAMKTHLKAIDKLKALSSSRRKIDPENLLDNAVLLVRDHVGGRFDDTDDSDVDFDERIEIDGHDDQMLVTEFLKLKLPEHHHCIIKSLRVPFSRRLCAAKKTQLSDLKQEGQAFLNVGMKPSIMYYKSDMPMMERVLKAFDQKIKDFLRAELQRALEIVRNVGSEHGVVF